MVFSAPAFNGAAWENPERPQIELAKSVLEQSTRRGSRNEVSNRGVVVAVNRQRVAHQVQGASRKVQVSADRAPSL